MDTRIKFSIRLPPEAVAVLDAMAEKTTARGTT
jgi:predicted DNA-binding protein